MLTESLGDECVCRTAPATPGLVITLHKFVCSLDVPIGQFIIFGQFTDTLEVCN